MSFTDRIKQFDEHFKITGKGKEMANKPDVIKAAMNVSKQETDKEKYDRIKTQSDISVLHKEIWNEAIEAAAEIPNYLNDGLTAALIRKLKK